MNEHVEVQDDGRIRHWVYIEELGRYLRVITLADGVTCITPSRIGAFGLPNRAMRVEYFPDTDTLYIALRDVPGADTREVGRGVVIDIDAEGEVVGIEVEHASERVDLATLKLDSIFSSVAGGPATT